jgi:hypothetical protein
VVDIWNGADLMVAPIQQIYLGEHQTFSIAGTTWNPSDKSANITLSNGNLTAAFTSASDGGVRSITSKSSGKWYAEFSPGATFTGSDTGFGIVLGSVALNAIGFSVTNACIVLPGANPAIWFNGSFSGVNLSPSGYGAAMGIAVDLDNKTLWFNNWTTGNAWRGKTTGATSDPATNTNGLDISAVFPGAGAFLCVCANNSGSSGTLNTGSSAFTGTVPSGFNAGWS